MGPFFLPLSMMIIMSKSLPSGSAGSVSYSLLKKETP